MTDPIESSTQTVSPAAMPWRAWQYFLLLGLIVGLVYYPGLSAPFIFDDQSQVEKNDKLLSLSPISKFTKLARPVGYFTFALNIACQGVQPFGLRLTNVIIHIASTCLLFWIFRHALKRRGNWRPFIRYANGLAFSMALLWGVHPLSTSAVTYIVQRFESLMSFFLLLMLVALWKGARSGRTHAAWPWFALAAGASFLGGATKEVMVVAPLIALLIDRAFLASSWRELFSKRWGVHIALFSSWVAIAGTHYLSSAGSDYSTVGFGSTYTCSPWEYLRSQPGVILRYLQLVFWPDRLILDYYWPVAQSNWQIYGQGSIILALLLGSVWLWWRRPRVGVVALSFFLLLALTSSILPITDLAFEHRMYLASAPVIILAVLGVFWVIHSLRNARQFEQVALAAIVFSAAALGLRTFVRNQTYCKPTQIWLQCLHYNPENGRAECILADELVSRGKNAEALPLYKHALPNHKLGKNYIHVYIGRLSHQAGNEEEALAHFLAAVPNPPDTLETHMMLADGLRMLGRPQEAKIQYEKIYKRSPNEPGVRNKLIWFLATCSDEAIRDPKRAVKLAIEQLQLPEPTVLALDSAAAAFAADGQYPRAVELAQQAEELARPHNAAAAVRIGDRRKLYEAGKPFIEVFNPPAAPPAEQPDQQPVHKPASSTP